MPLSRSISSVYCVVGWVGGRPGGWLGVHFYLFTLLAINPVLRYILVSCLIGSERFFSIGWSIFKATFEIGGYNIK